MADSRFKRGARRTPGHHIARAPKHIALAGPPQFAAVPKQLDMWGNDQYGDCVSAEEAFAIAAFSTMAGSERFVPTANVVSWAQSHGFLDGANLTDVMDAMAKAGMPDSQDNVDKDGPYSSVDYSTESVLQSAIAQGPVKIAIDANALPQGAGNQQGWEATGKGNYPNTDHCVSLCGYGPASYLYQQLGVPLPSGLSATKSGYLLFTWSTIGFVDHDWLMGTCVEAWVRNPTTVGVNPMPTPPTPNPTPSPFVWPTTLPATLTFNADGTVSNGGSPTWNVDMTVLPQLIRDFFAFIKVPMPTELHHFLSAADFDKPGSFNWTKLIQIFGLIMAWVSTGMNPAGLIALFQQIIAIITGP